jgi:peptidyl-prolyl cis-trans isomerase D
MLRGLRKSSTGWLGKTIMVGVVGFLALSFAIWGIGDIFRGFGRSTFAKIGSTEITIEQFRQLYNERLQQFSRQLGQPISMEQARARGFDRVIIGQLVAETSLDERARALRLGITDAEISKRITTDPAFQGSNGQFDRLRFEQVIRNLGFTEGRFIAEQRRQLLRRQLHGTIVGSSILPKAAVEAADRYHNEERSIDYVLLDRAKAGEVAPPTPEVLAKYFEDRKILFRAPEYRKLVVVTLIPSEQAHTIEISDADLKRAYEERRSRFVTAERREIRQILFPSAEEASAAADRIAKGETFDQLAADPAIKDRYTDLGMMTKAALIDRPIADAAFALKEGEVSAPVQGRFGTVLLQVAKIEPEHIRSFEEVAPELKQALATERAKAETLSIYDKLEDERSQGKTLAEAAEKLKLTVRTVEVDRSGRDRSGNEVADIPEAQRLLAGAFAAQLGVELDPLQVDGGYIWYDVVDIIPARDRSFEDVKPELERRWHEEEIANRLRTKANELLDKVKGGTPLAEVAAAEGLTVETRTGIKRSGVSAPLSERTIDAIFRTAKGAPGNAEGARAPDPSNPQAPDRTNSQIVFQVTDIVVPNVDLASAEAKNIRDSLSRTLSDDLFAEFLAQLENEIGVNINQAALRQVITGARGDIDDN